MHLYMRERGDKDDSPNVDVICCPGLNTDQANAPIISIHSIWEAGITVDPKLHLEGFIYSACV